MDLPEFADRLHSIMTDMMRLFLRRQTNDLLKGAITLPQFIILEFLKRSGDTKMSDIASFVHVSTPAATGLVDRLVQGGYASRLLDTSDRRLVKIHITSKGSGAVKQVNDQRRQMIIDTFGRMDEKERSDYLRILTKMRDILRETKEDRS